MALGDILQILQTGSVILAIIVAASTLRGKTDAKTETLVRMQSDIEYIKQRIDGLDGMRNSIIELMASSKSAHKRLDEHLKYDHNKDLSRRDD